MLLIGADPELFVFGEDGTFINGHGLVPGTKVEPFGVPKGAVQVDGMALEFNITPASSRQEFVDNVFSVRDSLAKMVSPYVLSNRSVVKFEDRWLRRQPAASRVLGCEPDYDAWMCCENFPPDNKTPMRTAAGHIHIGWTDNGPDYLGLDHLSKCASLIRHLDSTVGLWTVIADPGSAERRAMYGKAGAFRPKKYGVEWRVPSNFWVANRQLAGEIYDRVVTETYRWFNGDVVENPEVIDIINTSNVNAAMEIAA